MSPLFYFRSQCHSFSWSRELWYKASKEIFAVTSFLLVIYLALASWGMYYDGLRGIDIPCVEISLLKGFIGSILGISWMTITYSSRKSLLKDRSNSISFLRYVLACTLTTIGFGDLSPQSQHTRLAAVFFLPFGLIVISFGVANLKAFAMSKASEVIKKIENGTLNAEEPKVSKDEKSAPSIWDTMWRRIFEIVPAHIILLLRDYVLIILVGVIFFYFNERERRLQEQRRDVDMTLVDAFYFATVTATTVGYGHSIWPASGSAKLFMIFYSFASTGVVGATIRNIASLHIERKREEIHAKFMYVAFS